MLKMLFLATLFCFTVILQGNGLVAANAIIQNAESPGANVTSLMSSYELHWPSWLQSTTLSVFHLGQLVAIAAIKDFPLDTITIHNNYTYINHSRFRPLLLQVANDGFEMFKAVHNNLDYVSWQMLRVPNNVRACLSIMDMNETETDIDERLQIPRAAMLDAVTRSAIAANNAMNKVIQMDALLGELGEVLGANQGTSERLLAQATTSTINPDLQFQPKKLNLEEVNVENNLELMAQTLGQVAAIKNNFNGLFYLVSTVHSWVRTTLRNNVNGLRQYSHPGYNPFHQMNDIRSVVNEFATEAVYMALLTNCVASAHAEVSRRLLIPQMSGISLLLFQIDPTQLDRLHNETIVAQLKIVNIVAERRSAFLGELDRQSILLNFNLNRNGQEVTASNKPFSKFNGLMGLD